MTFNNTYLPGEAVYHQVFGAGTVSVFVPGASVDDDRVEVNFQQSGRKWLAPKYASLVRTGARQHVVKHRPQDSAWNPVQVIPNVEAESSAITPAQPKEKPPEKPIKKSRRNVLKLLAGIIGVAPLAAVAATAKPDKRARTLPVLESRIAGFAHYQGEQCLPAIKPGDALRLQRQPANPHDGKAIEVFWNNHKIGYVPKSHNAALSKLMDSGEVVAVSVSRVLERPWEPLEFNVYLRV